MSNHSACDNCSEVFGRFHCDNCGEGERDVFCFCEGMCIDPKFYASREARNAAMSEEV